MLTVEKALELQRENERYSYTTVVLKREYGVKCLMARTGHCGGTDYDVLGHVTDDVWEHLVEAGVEDWHEQFKKQ